MNQTQTSNTTYAHFLKIWEGSINSKEEVHYESHLQKIRFADEMDDMSPSILFLADLQKMQYIYISKNIYRFSGYRAEDFLVKGWHFTFSLIHPEDKYELTHKVQPAQIAFLRSLPYEELKKYKFDYNYRFKKANGEYVHVHKQDIVVQKDQKGSPLLMLGVANNISHLKKDTQISLSVTEFDQQSSNTQYLYQSKQDLVSKRELEVLKLILAGRTTEQIAKELSVSQHTVKNHRRNMIEKTGAKNMAAVIQLAFSKGVLQ